MTKVGFFDSRVLAKYYKLVCFISAIFSLVLSLGWVPVKCNQFFGVIFLFLLVVTYVCIWVHSNYLNKININIEGSDVTIKVGDIFTESGYKAIGFNEYFDTVVDNNIISEHSLNGIFVKKHLKGRHVSDLDKHILDYPFKDYERLGRNDERVGAKI